EDQGGPVPDVPAAAQATPSMAAQLPETESPPPSAELPRAEPAPAPAPQRDDSSSASGELASQLREAEREAALARERAEADDLRRRAEASKPSPTEPAPAPKEAPPKLAAAVAAPSGALKCPAGMQLVPAGPFTMGSSSSDPMRNFGEGIATKTDVAAFCIDYYEFPNSSSRAPTVRTTWAQAKAACEGKGRRLCAEAEWEKACKGPGDKRFPYGNNYDESACNTEGAGGQPRQPDSARAFKGCRSGYGVYALSGNAEEWVADSFKAGTSSKTAKGGAADRPDWASRCAARRGLASNTARDTLGFRCCADPG
ncbi:MAG: formylglycine-generating enzyme family protein, partial [Myxococcota bacterium]